MKTEFRLMFQARVRFSRKGRAAISVASSESAKRVELRLPGLRQWTAEKLGCWGR